MFLPFLALALTPLLGQTEPGNAEVPWPVKLGAQSLHRSNQIPMVDQVVLVPDADTWLDEVARWSLAGQWPVLIEDDHLAPMFIRRFKPASVIRRSAVAPPGISKMDRCQLILARAWGGQQGETFVDAMKRQNLKPLGLVLTSESSTAWPAAVALAVGRGQLLTTLDGTFGGGGTILGAARAKALAELVRSRVVETGLSWQSLGDDIDAITICRNFPARARFDLPATARVKASNIKPDDPLAITDVLGRREDGERYAIVGWINGSEAEAAYAAMCSLFLVPETAWLCNGYPATGQWSQYAMEEAAAILGRAGFQCTVTGNAGLDELRARSTGGIQEDLVLMNSKGNRDFFDLGKDRGTPNDVPVLSSPAALQMIHSWSLQDPSNTNTVGGRWLAHGVYAYVGSSHEPFLSAFVPPSDVARRLTQLVPFLVSGRWWTNQGPFSHAWRINTLGDPLMTVGPPSLTSRPRINPSPTTGSAQRGMDLREDAERLMRNVATSPSPGQLTLSIKSLNLLGEDDLARQMWTFGQQKNVINASSASEILGPLFRLQDRDAFVEAWQLVQKPTQFQRDMLWQLLGPSLAASTDEDVLVILESEVKGPTPSSYIEILGPHLARAFGSTRVIGLIQQAKQGARSGQQKKRLEALLRQYSTGR